MASKFSPLQSFIILIIFASAAATANALDDQTLDVHTLTGNTYLAMLQRIRSGLARTYSKNVAVLPVFVDTPNPPMFDVVLRTSARQISVRVREDNLYVVGYRMQIPTPKWLELGSNRSAPHLIANSEFLGFDGDYLSLERASGTNALAISFTRYDLINAVDQLADTTNGQVRAEHMIRLIYMISESTRFADLSTLLARNLNAASSRLEPYMSDLVKNWETYSTMVLRTDADPCYKFVRPEVEDGKYDTVDELRNRFGLMYRDPITLCPPCQPVPCTQAAAALNGNIIPMIEMVAQA